MSLPAGQPLPSRSSAFSPLTLYRAPHERRASPSLLDCPPGSRVPPMPIRIQAPPSWRTPRLARRLALCATFALPAATSPAWAQATAGLAADPVPADDALAAARFDDARALYDGGLFGPAARALGRFRDAYPRDVRAPEALFLHAESALAVGDATTAAALFARFEADYPGSPLAPRARAALGRFYYAPGRVRPRRDGPGRGARAPRLRPWRRPRRPTCSGMTRLRQNRPRRRRWRVRARRRGRHARRPGRALRARDGPHPAGRRRWRRRRLRAPLHPIPGVARERAGPPRPRRGLPPHGPPAATPSPKPSVAARR